MMGVKSGTTEPAILVCDCYHLLCVFVFLLLDQDLCSGPGLGCSMQGLSNLLMFILTFDQHFNFSLIQGLNLFYWKS